MGVLTSTPAGLLLVVTEKVTEVAPDPKPSENLWVVLLVAILGSSVVAALFSSVVAGVREAATARRAGYASAVKTLIARAEYPYRIRRRTSDDPAVLAALSTLGNDLQEQLAAARIWVATEHPELGRRYEKALAAIEVDVNPMCADAWTQEPITTPAGMNLAGWGPPPPGPHLLALEKAIAYRFGWRRFVPSRRWKP